jgi:hypothetical protein
MPRTKLKLACFLSNFSAKNLLINSHQAHQIAAHPYFIISQWVYQMIIQAHLGIIMQLWTSCWVEKD